MVSGNQVTGCYPAVHADARTGRQVEQYDCASGGHRSLIGVFGIETNLDRVPDLRRCFAHQRLAGREEQLQLDQVEPGGGLGDGVLDRQTGIHLQEGEGLLGRQVEELDAAHPAVSSRPHHCDS